MCKLLDFIGFYCSMPFSSVFKVNVYLAIVTVVVIIK